MSTIIQFINLSISRLEVFALGRVRLLQHVSEAALILKFSSEDFSFAPRSGVNTDEPLCTFLIIPPNIEWDHAYFKVFNIFIAWYSI